MHKSSALLKVSSYLHLIILATGLFLIIRNTGIYPVVFSDEYYHSTFSRLVPFSDATIPNYFFYLIYRSTSLCGDGFLECARILNVVFFLAAAPFIYITAKLLTDEKTSLLISVLAVAGPINTYTAYFMPESLYFFSFWLFTYVILLLTKKHKILIWLTIGFLFGICSLIKPHTLFLAPALAIYLFFIQHQHNNGEKEAFDYWKYCSFFVSALATKMVLGFLLGGFSGITLFGSNYTSVVAETVEEIRHYADLITLVFENLQGHLLSLFLLFSVPIAHIFLTSRMFIKYNSDQQLLVNIALYTSLILLSLLFTAALFTASIAGFGPHETNARLHMRYYNFIFPLFLLVVASQLSCKSIDASFKSKLIVGIPIGVSIAYTVYTQLAPYTPSIVDSPELRGFTLERSVFYILSGLSIFSLLLWVYEIRTGIKVFLYLFAPLAVVFSTFYANNELRQRLVPDVFDKAGMFTKQYLSNEEISRVLIIGSDPGGLFRALFYLDSPKASLETVPEGVAYDLSKIPDEKEWILAIGDYLLIGNTFYRIKMDGFTLVRASDVMLLDFKKVAWPGIISSSGGLSATEPWGTWSASDTVTFTFFRPLPDRFKVRLVAHAFGSNIEEEFVARVGDRAVKFMLGASSEEKVLEFKNNQGAKVLIIDVPCPVSPKELGLGADERKLGIAFIELAIEPF